MDTSNGISFGDNQTRRQIQQSHRHTEAFPAGS